MSTEIKREAAHTPTDDAALDWPLPCDVRVGNGTHRKGTSLRTLVVRMRMLHEAAFGPMPSKEEQAANLAALQSVARAPDLAAEVERLREERDASEKMMRAAYENACAHRAAAAERFAAERRKVEAAIALIDARDQERMPSYAVLRAVRAALASTEGGAK